jgi:putative transcriptional regulator
MSDAGKRLIRSASQARRIARGEEAPARAFIPPEIDVKGIRSRICLTQDDFASEFGFTTSQIRDWEQNRYRPLGSDRAYLMIIDKHPDVVRKMLKEAIRSAEAVTECEPIAKAV